MTGAFRFTGILIVGLAALAAAMSIGGGKAHAAGATIDCEIPLAVECDISHPDGIANVTVTVDFGDLGLIDVVDKDFDCEEEVTVSWDPIVPNASFEVTPCGGFGFDGSGRGDGGHDLGLTAKPGRGDPSGLLVMPRAYVAPSTPDAAGVHTVTAYSLDDTMDICHKLGNGTYKVMTINDSAWPAHKAHGDGTVIGHLLDGTAVCVFLS